MNDTNHIHDSEKNNIVSSSGTVRSRDEIVADINQGSLNHVAGNKVQLVASEDEYQVRRLAQVIRNMQGQFVLLFAVCNKPSKRRELTKQIERQLPGHDFTEVMLTGSDSSILDVLFTAEGTSEPLIVYDIEKLLPSEENAALRDRTLQELQVQRERFRKLNRPLILWMPEYVYELIGQRAVDFWSWQSGGFFFSEQPARPGIITQTSSVNSLYQLRAPVADFVGRESELEQLVTTLTTGNRVAAIVGICGMAGIGKTELAVIAANRVATYFPDGQISVELSGSTTTPLAPSQALQQVIRVFKPIARLPDDEVTLSALYRSLLHGKRVLIFADDAWDAAQVRLLLPPSGCALLITSRSAFSLPRIQHFYLGALSKEEAINLLLELEPRIGEYAPELARMCGYLPLALRVSATFLRQSPSRSVKDYLQNLRDEQTRLTRLHYPENLAWSSVEASLALSYDRLKIAEQRVFAQLGVFIGSFTLEAAEAIIDAEGNIVADLLNELYLSSLVEFDVTTERYDLHDLARAFALCRLHEQGNERITRLRHARYYQRIASHAENELYFKGRPLEGLALFDRERRQIDTAWGWLMQQDEPDPAIDELLLDFANATAYVGELRYDLRRERIPQLEAQRDAARRLERKDQEGTALGNLGIAYKNLGDYPRAIAHHEQYLAIARELGDRRGEGTALGNLGLAYAALGDYPRAIDYHEQALAVMRDLGD
ncbi:MAG: ATP-binding protein, partial [Chloroflexaceae bacterium]